MIFLVGSGFAVCTNRKHHSIHKTFHQACGSGRVGVALLTSACTMKDIYVPYWWVLTLKDNQANMILIKSWLWSDSTKAWPFHEYICNKVPLCWLYKTIPRKIFYRLHVQWSLSTLRYGRISFEKYWSIVMLHSRQSSNDYFLVMKKW